MLESFRIRSFRYQWGADAFATWAAEMETLLIGWYVLVDTGSPFLVGLVGALRFGGTLLAPLYGVAADRIDRRTFLIALRLLQALQAAVLAALALTGTLVPWHAFAISAAGGLVRMGENVVRQSLIADVVPPGALMNAVGLSRTTMDSAKIAGSLAGAGLLSHLGMGSAYAGVTLLYLAGTALVLGVTVPAPAGSTPDDYTSSSTGGTTTTATAPAADSAPPQPSLSPQSSVLSPVSARQPAESPFANLRSGVGYMRHSPTIVAIMFLAFLVNLTVFPLTNGLMPVVARDAFAFGPEGLALLLTAVSVGAVAGSLLLAAFPRWRRPERTMLASIALWHALLLVFVWLAHTAGPTTSTGAAGGASARALGGGAGGATSTGAACFDGSVTDQAPCAGSAGVLARPSSAAPTSPMPYWPILLVLAGYGAVTSGSMVTMSAVLLSTADVAFRGRVMGVRMMAVYGLPMGLLLGGYLSERFGVYTALTTLGLLGLALTALAALRWPALLRGTSTAGAGVVTVSPVGVSAPAVETSEGGVSSLPPPGVPQRGTVAET